jgi:hypothetical protein
MAAGNGETEAANQAFRPDLYQAQILTDHARPLKRLAAALRRTKGQMGASYLRLRTHAAASGFLRGGRMARDRFVVSADAMKSRKIFRRKAARR